VELFSRVLQNCALKSLLRLPLFIFEDKNNQINRNSLFTTDILTVYSLCLNPCNTTKVHRQGTSEQLFEWMWAPWQVLFNPRRGLWRKQRVARGRL